MKLFFMIIWTKITEIIYKITTKQEKNNFKANNKILLIKPYFYLDLYTKNSDEMSNVPLSSYYRLGPVGLFTDLNSDFFITNSEVNKEQKDKISKRLITKENITLHNEQKKNSINVNNINFNEYDIVFAYEGAVSKEIINKNKKTKWGLILEDHSQKNFKKYCLKKPSYYDFFLNLTQGYTLYSLFRRKHCIDFSYTFGSSKFMQILKLEKKHNIDVLIEIHQPEKLKKSLDKENMKIEKLDGGLKVNEYIKKLANSKIFFCPLFTTPRWGNSIIEAALCRCLIIGNKYSYWNSLLIHKDLHCTSISKGKKILNKISQDRNLYNFYLDEQNKKLDMINYKLPLNQIQKLISNFT